MKYMSPKMHLIVFVVQCLLAWVRMLPHAGTAVHTVRGQLTGQKLHPSTPLDHLGSGTRLFE